MESVTFLGKSNNDGSYSVSVRAGDLVRLSFVDFYEDATGQGYQRNEATRATRGNAVRDYIKRCVQANLPPQLFEITASFRGSENAWSWDPLGERDEEIRVGFLVLRHEAQKRVLSIIDGGTRLLGIQKAMDEQVIDPDILLDVRVFTGLSLAHEISQFLLINDKQKKVRTDLGLRVVQRLLDEGEAVRRRASRIVHRRARDRLVEVRRESHHQPPQRGRSLAVVRHDPNAWGQDHQASEAAGHADEPATDTA